MRRYANHVLTEQQWKKLRDKNVKLYGPTGLRKYIAERSIEAFIKLYFYDEMTLDFAPIHVDMIADMQRIRDSKVASGQGEKIARAIPRNHAKSTFYSRILPLHGFLYGWSPLTVLLGNNDDASKRMLANIKTMIETSDSIREDFPSIRGEYWGNERLQASNGATLMSFGVGSGSIRGVSTGQHRPSLIILDDIDDDRSVRSAVELANNREWLDKTILPLGDNVLFTTSFVAVGTIIRKTSLMKYILDSPAFKSRIESAVIHFASNQALWDIWKEHILDLARNNNQPTKPTEDTFYQAHKAEMLEGTAMLWDRPDAYWYAMMVKLQNEAAFWSELQNNPRESNNTFGDVCFINIATLNESEYEVLASLDPTTTGNKTSDYASFVEVLFHRQRKEVVIAYADVAKRNYADTIDSIVRRVSQRGRIYDAFWIETNAAGLIISDLLHDRLNRERIPLLVTGIHNRIPKNERINTLTEYIRRGQLFFADNLPEEAMREIESWPISANDDFLDSVANVVIQLKELGLLDLIKVDDNPYMAIQ